MQQIGSKNLKHKNPALIAAAVLAATAITVPVAVNRHQRNKNISATAAGN